MRVFVNLEFKDLKIVIKPSKMRVEAGKKKLVKGRYAEFVDGCLKAVDREVIEAVEKYSAKHPGEIDEITEKDYNRMQTLKVSRKDVMQYADYDKEISSLKEQVAIIKKFIKNLKTIQKQVKKQTKKQEKK